MWVGKVLVLEVALFLPLTLCELIYPYLDSMDSADGEESKESAYSSQNVTIDIQSFLFFKVHVYTLLYPQR
jgi:hypothetical protein